LLITLFVSVVCLQFGIGYLLSLQQGAENQLKRFILWENERGKSISTEANTPPANT